MMDSFLTHFRRRLQSYRPYQLAREVQRSLEKFRQSDHRFISLKPQGADQGNVLLSYINAPFFLKPGEPVSHAHTQDWESLQIAKTFLEMDYAVDVIRYSNLDFIPRKPYAFLIDARFNLERLTPLLNHDCVRIMHADTAHCLFHNAAEARRLLELQQRRNIALYPRRYMQPNRAVEYAHHIVVLGNEFTLNTYRYANKPLYRLPISTPVLYPWPDGKDFEASRQHFLWFGSGGMVHKGLDLVLEAFAGLPDLHLTVCGPVQHERDFVCAYYKELHETPNIHTLGWVDIASPEFLELTTGCLAVVYPSSSEGTCGSVITCMHAGLIPVVSYESGVDVSDEFGIVLRRCAVDDIRQAVRGLASRPAGELRAMARCAWEFARAHHTHECFAEAYRQVVNEIRGV